MLTSESWLLQNKMKLWTLREDVLKTNHAKSSLFLVSKLEALDSILDALDSNLNTRKLRGSMIEDRVSKFELRGTVNLHLHGTVCAVEICSYGLYNVLIGL